jgi:hypothetical protein
MDKQLKKRCDQIIKLNMRFNGESYIGKEDYNKDFNIHHTEITCDTDDMWNTKISKMTIELNKRRNK